MSAYLIFRHQRSSALSNTLMPVEDICCTTRWERYSYFHSFKLQDHKRVDNRRKLLPYVDVIRRFETMTEIAAAN